MAGAAGPWWDADQAERAVARWADWYDTERPHSARELGELSKQAAVALAQMEVALVSLIRPRLQAARGSRARPG